MLKTFRALTIVTLGATLTLMQLLASCGQQHKARLDSYRALATRKPTSSPMSSEDSKKSTNQHQNAQLAAASLVLSREDLIPCASLPARQLTLTNGTVLWLDGSWSNYARPFIVKGSAQSGVCRIELHPTGTSNLNLGGRDAFVRGSEVRVLLSGPNGESLFPPSNNGFVKCMQKNNSFEITYEGALLGYSAVSYVMNESVPLELNQRVCLARILDASKNAMSEWVFILPTWDPITTPQSSVSQQP
ncbi:MAG: hypothetical protein RL189_1713 [Pseudomonadota bacterium]|jgi:hypothetical protein